MSTKDRPQLHVRVTNPVYRRVRILAAEQNMTINDVVERLIDKGLALEWLPPVAATSPVVEHAVEY